MKPLATSMGSALVITLCAWVPLSFAQTTPKPEYRLKEPEPIVGSNIRRNTVTSSHIPLNQSYEQMSLADRRIVHSLYEQIADGDEPPFPLNGMKDIYGPLEKAHQILVERGHMFVVATVDADGVVQSVSVQESPSKKMSEFAAKVLLLTRFKPAMCSGQRCKMDFPLRMTFTVTH